MTTTNPSVATVQQPAPVLTSESREVLPVAHAMCVAAGHINITPDLESRIEQGVRTYGVPLHSHNGRDNDVDGYQERLDAVIYGTAAAIEGRGSLAVRTQRRKALEAQMHATEQQRILLAMIEKEARP